MKIINTYIVLEAGDGIYAHRKVYEIEDGRLFKETDGGFVHEISRKQFEKYKANLG